MHDNLTSYQKRVREFILNPRVWLFTIGAIIIVVILIFIITKVFRQNPYGAEIRITNLSDYVPDLPQDKKDTMFNMLYTRAATELGTTDLPSATAEVRGGSLVTQDTSDIHSGSFIVDIENLSLSFYIQYEWSDDENAEEISSTSVVISCPPAGLGGEKYPCNSANDANVNGDLSAVLANNTPAYGTTASGAEYILRHQYYNGGDIYLEVNVNACGDQKTLDEAKAIAIDWLKSLYLDSSSVPIELRNLCDGGM